MLALPALCSGPRKSHYVPKVFLVGMPRNVVGKRRRRAQAIAATSCSVQRRVSVTHEAAELCGREAGGGSPTAIGGDRGVDAGPIPRRKRALELAEAGVRDNRSSDMERRVTSRLDAAAAPGSASETEVRGAWCAMLLSTSLCAGESNFFSRFCTDVLPVWRRKKAGLQPPFLAVVDQPIQSGCHSARGPRGQHLYLAGPKAGGSGGE